MPRPVNHFHRVFSKYVMPTTRDDCWIWGGTICTTTGYGITMENYKKQNAHRYIYEGIIEKLDDSLELDHLCRNRKCVNPYHLEAVTSKENVRRGLVAKLTMEKASEIRTKLAMGIKQSALAIEYNVSPSAISRIKSNKRWA